MYHNWVASRKTRKHWFLKEENSPGETRCKKSCDSLSLRYVKKVSGKERKIAWNNTSPESSSASHEETDRKSSHELPMESRAKVEPGSGKHSVYTHLSKDGNCEICQRTKITRAPCRRPIGGAVLRATNFGDLITADHQILSEGGESRNDHPYAVVVQDLSTQWLQSYSCKTKTSQETQKSLMEFLESTR